MNQIGLVIIKDLDNQKGCTEIQEVHYQINHIIFKNQQRYAYLPLVKDVLNQLIECGTKLKDIDLRFKSGARNKRDEIVNRLRTICLDLQKYCKNYRCSSEEEAYAIRQTVNFQVSKSIAIKKTLDISKILTQLEANKKIFNMLKEGIVKYDIDDRKLDEITNELLNVVVEEYQLNS